MRNEIIEWVSKVGTIIEAVPQIAVSDLIEESRKPIASGGLMPVDKGNLRNSGVISFSEMPLADRKITPDTRLVNPAASNNAAIRNLTLGQKLRFGYTANYALEQEQKHGFVRIPAQRWLQIVKNAVRTAKMRNK